MTTLRERIEARRTERALAASDPSVGLKRDYPLVVYTLVSLARRLSEDPLFKECFGGKVPDWKVDRGNPVTEEPPPVSAGAAARASFAHYARARAGAYHASLSAGHSRLDVTIPAPGTSGIAASASFLSRDGSADRPFDHVTRCEVTSLASEALSATLNAMIEDHVEVLLDNGIIGNEPEPRTTPLIETVRRACARG
jgi:hypothetical protein